MISINGISTGIFLLFNHNHNDLSISLIFLSGLSSKMIPIIRGCYKKVVQYVRRIENKKEITVKDSCVFFPRDFKYRSLMASSNFNLNNPLLGAFNIVD